MAPQAERMREAARRAAERKADEEAREAEQKARALVPSAAAARRVVFCAF